MRAVTPALMTATTPALTVPRTIPATPGHVRSNTSYNGGHCSLPASPQRFLQPRPLNSSNIHDSVSSSTPYVNQLLSALHLATPQLCQLKPR